MNENIRCINQCGATTIFSYKRIIGGKRLLVSVKKNYKLISILT